MPGSFLNCFISAAIGAASAVGTVWYLSDNSKTGSELELNSNAVSTRRLEVDSLIVRDNLLLVDKASSEPTLELREGSVFAQNGVYADHIGAFRLLGQKFQTTPGDPLDSKSAVFGEMAINEDGGSYIALLSPRESHSVTIGFDKNEKGCIVSQNNEDMSMVAQAIFLRPDASPSNSNVPEAMARSNPPASDAPLVTVAQDPEGNIRK